MKLLENSQFEALSNALSTENVFSIIATRIESYSCKMAGDCKRQYKQLHDKKTGISPPDYQMLGPSSTVTAQLLSQSTSPMLSNNLTNYMRSRSVNNANITDDEQQQQQQQQHSGSFNSSSIDIISKKTLFYLISTLNASFQPDYDFTNTLSSEFSKEPSIEFVIKNVENFLATVDVYSKLKQQIWDSIDKEINLNECEFYSYNPDLASDPCAEDGCLWFFNFFVYNKKMKRIVFFSCRCTSKSIDSNLDDDEDVNDDLILEENSYDETAASRFYSAVSNISTTSTASVAVAAVFTSSGETIIGYME